jgi:SAM-dependent methyltransferase
VRLRTAATWLTGRVLGAVYGRFLPEERRLARIWRAYPPELLDRYLVSGYQNPRINVQSILARHAIARRLFGRRFAVLMDEEIRFAVELNEILRNRAEELGVTMGSYLNPWKQARVLDVGLAIADREREFERRWAAELAGLEAARIRVIELACGSANDYRTWVDYGLARFLDYSGFDLNPVNIENARRRFPNADFRVGSVLDLGVPDASADLVVAFDIFEHLSLPAMRRALDEALRAAREGLVLAFFNMAEIPDHVERPTGMYHWNRLSRAQIAEQLRAQFPSVEVVPVARLLDERYDYPNSYNRGAYTMVAAHAPLLRPDITTV